MTRKYQYVTVSKTDQRRETMNRNISHLPLKNMKKKKEKEEKTVYLNLRALCHAGSVLMNTVSTLACSVAKRLRFQLLKGIKHMTSAGSSAKTVQSIPG